jgi:hypothetical protein
VFPQMISAPQNQRGTAVDVESPGKLTHCRA